MNFIKFKSMDGNEIAVNMDMVSEIIDMPGTYDICRRTRILFNSVVNDDYSFRDVTETIDEILNKITSNKL